ncbi:hypothetical protein FocTR4_00005485, partial [Fusarium oxysporum f. sp. cubense]
SLVREHRKEKDAEEEEKKSSISLLRGVSIGSNTAAKELLIIKRLRKTEASWAVGQDETHDVRSMEPGHAGIEVPHIPRGFSSLGASLIAVDSGQGAV